MAAVTLVGRWLRLDRPTWARLTADANLAAAASIAVGAFAFFAFARFGFQVFVVPRAAARFLLTGLYGWIGLAVGTALVGRIASGRGVESYRIDLSAVLRLFGLAHLPLVLLAMILQISALFLNVPGVGRAVAVFVFIFWMPGQLVAAARAAFDTDSAQAAALVVGPYVIWLLVIGGVLLRQLGHFL